MSWTRGLNPEQAKAVQHNYGPLLILAGAGSGKTTVLVARTGRLIAENIVKATEILVLTFTNKAARELKHRVAARLGEAGEGIWAGTFHSFGLQLLKKYHKQANLHSHFGIVDTSDCHAILKDLMRDIKIAGKDNYDIDELLNQVNERRTGQAMKNKAVDEYGEMAELLAPKFSKRLELLGVVDFEALLIKPIELLKNHPEIREKIQKQFQQIMVDEFQDTNRLQMELVRLLVGEHQNIAVVGDDDQSIYGWRGAQVANILDFPHKYKKCEVIKLERNYRSSPAILDLANTVIAKNKSRHGKILRSDSAQEKGLIPELFVIENEDEECEFVVREIQNFLAQQFQPKDIAILYRSNTQGGLIESALRRSQIDYAISGGTSIFERKEAKDVLAYIKQALLPNDVSLRRIINTPNRGIGDTSLERLNEYAMQGKISFAQACQHWREAGVPEKAGLSIENLLAFLRQMVPRILKGEGTPGMRLLQLMHELGYKDYLIATSKDGMAADKKWLVVEIMGRILDSFLAKRVYEIQSLRDFIDAMMLREDPDEDDKREKVQLMTLHASKGLEFPIVLLIGVEEDLLPHRSLGSDIDEERRLFYVGITRAKQRLILARCQQRKRHGAVRPVAPSRFILDLPPGLFTEYPGSFRPVSGEQRENLVGDFLKKLQSRTETKDGKKI